MPTKYLRTSIDTHIPPRFGDTIISLFLSLSYSLELSNTLTGTISFSAAIDAEGNESRSTRSFPSHTQRYASKCLRTLDMHKTARTGWFGARQFLGYQVPQYFRTEQYPRRRKVSALRCIHTGYEVLVQYLGPLSLSLSLSLSISISTFISMSLSSPFSSSSSAVWIRHHGRECVNLASGAGRYMSS